MHMRTNSVLGFNIFSLYLGELVTVCTNYSIYPKNPQTKTLRRNIENWHWNTIQTKIQTIQKLRKWYVLFEHFTRKIQLHSLITYNIFKPGLDKIPWLLLRQGLKGCQLGHFSNIFFFVFIVIYIYDGHFSY